MSSITNATNQKNIIDQASHVIDDFKNIEKQWFAKYEALLLSLKEEYQRQKTDFPERSHYPSMEEITSSLANWTAKQNHITSKQQDCCQLKTQWNAKVQEFTTYCLSQEIIQKIKKLDATNGEKIEQAVCSLKTALSEIREHAERIHKVASTALEAPRWIDDHPKMYLLQMKPYADQRKGALDDTLNSFRRHLQRAVTSWTGFDHSSEFSQGS